MSIKLQASAPAKTIHPTPTPPAKHRQSDMRLFIVIFVIMLCLTPLLVLSGAAIGFSYLVGAIVALALAALIVRWPTAGFFMVAGCALLVEQEPLPVSGTGLNLYVFYWPNGLTGLVERPIGVLILFTFLLFICHNLARHRKLLEGGPLLLPFLFFLLCVAIGVVHGLTGGGNTKIIVLEVRPFWYLFLAYLLGYNLIKNKKHIRSIFWMIIVCAGIKALQGVYIYLFVIHGDLSGYHQILAHEESFFFVAILLLVMLFCLHYRYRPQFYTALFILPFLIIALIANQRRADYIALLVGMAVAWVLIFLVMPHMRKKLAVVMLVFVLLGSAYVAAFYHSGGSLAAPARAIIAVFYPDPADVANYNSNQYRIIENFDLEVTVKQSPLIGYGFGKPFLQPVPLPVLATTDPTFNGNPYLYIPHNTIYWVWMRLGAIGFLAFWYLIGAIVVRGCQVVRQLRDRYLQLLAIFVVSITFMEIIVAYADYQLYFYRNVIYLGLLVGLLMKLPNLDMQEEQVAHEAAHDIRLPARSGLGR